MSTWLELGLDSSPSIRKVEVVREEEAEAE